MLAIFDPDVPDSIVRCTQTEFLLDNEAGLSPAELKSFWIWLERRALPGDAISIPSGGGCFFVVVYEGDGYVTGQGWLPDAYRVEWADGQYLGVHNGRPEPIDYQPLS